MSRVQLWVACAFVRVHIRRIVCLAHMARLFRVCLNFSSQYPFFRSKCRWYCLFFVVFKSHPAIRFMCLLCWPWDSAFPLVSPNGALSLSISSTLCVHCLSSISIARSWSCCFVCQSTCCCYIFAQVPQLWLLVNDLLFNCTKMTLVFCF